MKKQYTRKHICEAIAYWQKQLKKLNESNDRPDYLDTDPFRALTWGEMKKIIDKSVKDDDKISYVHLAMVNDYLGSVKDVYDVIADVDGNGNAELTFSTTSCG